MSQPGSFSYPPRGLAREEAARYIGVTSQTFDSMVAAGSMPNPRQIGRQLVWDRLLVDAAFTALPVIGQGSGSPAVSGSASSAHLSKVFSARTLAEFWMCSERHVRNLCESGSLPSFKLGDKLLRIRRADVEQYEFRQEIRPNASPVEMTATDDVAAKPKAQRAARLDHNPLVRARLKNLKPTHDGRPANPKAT